MKELLTMIGKRGYITVNGWIVALEVTDVKKVFGHEKLECTQPLSNISQWINRGSFTEIRSEASVTFNVQPARY